MPDSGPTAQRKVDHVRINLEEDVSSTASTGFGRFRFVHRALPEIDFDDVDTAGTFLGLPVRAPLLVSSMTGGAASLAPINRCLAEAAQEAGIAMGLGSMRAALESHDLAATFRVRDLAPDIPLLANLGAVQLNYGMDVDACRRAVDLIGADALVLHLNPLQEALQPEGDTRWSGLLAGIETVCRDLQAPVVAKEVGWGISGPVARQLADAGVAAIDVAGAGGTSWSEVEKHRNPSPAARAVAAAFRGWGIPTAESLLAVGNAAPDVELIASGGLRDGMDVAKAVALGAMLAGMAGPYLHAAAESTEAVLELLHVQVVTLRTVMFAVGAPDLGSLRRPGTLVAVE
jgi:isopentenyl-diphosphate delta-isomerase